MKWQQTKYHNIAGHCATLLCKSYKELVLFLFVCFFRYVPWNLHEPERGTFNFQDQLDLKCGFHILFLPLCGLVNRQKKTCRIVIFLCIFQSLS